MKENSFLNRGNLEEEALSQDHGIPHEKIMGAGTQFMGLEMDWVTEIDADPSTADADPPTADADPPTADADLPTADADPLIADAEPSTAGTVMPFVDIYNQLE